MFRSFRHHRDLDLAGRSILRLGNDDCFQRFLSSSLPVLSCVAGMNAPVQS